MAKASSQEHILRQKEENDIEKTRQQPLENDMEKELKFWLLWIDGWIVRGDTSERLFADWKFAFSRLFRKKENHESGANPLFSERLASVFPPFWEALKCSRCDIYPSFQVNSKISWVPTANIVE